jgi:hypothetical protein
MFMEKDVVALFSQNIVVGIVRQDLKMMDVRVEEMQRLMLKAAMAEELVSY